MRSFCCLLVMLGVSCCSQFAGAQALVVEQPSHAGLSDQQDHGVYAVQWQELGGDDPDRAIAFDNFELSQAIAMTEIRWTGIYAEPFPATVSDTDFLVTIWNDEGGAPGLDSSVRQFVFEGGSVAGESGSDLTVTENPGLSPSPSTLTTVGGGLAFDYAAPVDGGLDAGNYWISIVADQRFDSEFPDVDPEWQWHLADTPTPDGFFAADFTFDPPDSPAFGVPQNGDLAFAIQGTIVPEPSLFIPSLVALSALCAFYRSTLLGARSRL